VYQDLTVGKWCVVATLDGVGGPVVIFSVLLIIIVSVYTMKCYDNDDVDH